MLLTHLVPLLPVMGAFAAPFSETPQRAGQVLALRAVSSNERHPDLAVRARYFQDQADHMNRRSNGTARGLSKRGSGDPVSVSGMKVDVQLGNPAQTVSLKVDTGSSDLWVSATIFDRSKSTSFVDTGEKLDSRYVDSSFGQGIWGRDKVQVGAGWVPDLKLGVADTHSDGLDGMFGWGWGADYQTNWWQIMCDQIWEEKLFAIAVDGNNNGEMMLGGTNPSKYSGDIQWSDSVNGGWTIVLGGVEVGVKRWTWWQWVGWWSAWRRTQISLETSLGNTGAIATMDTGTDAINGPESVVKKIYAAIPGSRRITDNDGWYMFPCSTEIEIVFNFANYRWGVPLNLGTVSEHPNMCRGSIFAGTGMEESNTWLVGLAFLRHFYSVWRKAPTTSVGLADRR